MTKKDLLLPSNRKFGVFFGLLSLASSGYLYFRSSNTSAYMALLLACGLIFISFVRPSLLLPLNRAWMNFGEMLGKVVSPIVIGAIYFGLISPVAVITRVFGRDELRLGKSEESSYWIPRGEDQQPNQTFKNQF